MNKAILNMNKAILTIILTTLTAACSHQKINLRANHFLTPVVADDRYSGHIEVAVTSQSSITITEDTSTNPPVRNKVRINDDIDNLSLLYIMPIEHLSLDAGISVYDGLELLINGSLLGIKYQFLNHRQENAWTAAAFGGFGNHSQEKNSTSSSGGGSSSIDTEANVNISRAGVSLGYRFTNWTPYASYIYEKFDVTSEIKNSHGTFKDLKDSGTHNSLSVGVTTSKPGFSMAAEYSLINLDWDRAEDREWQGAFGARFGYAW